MLRKFALLAVLFSFITLFAGCNTIGGAVKGATEGAKEDWETAKKADAWIKENLW